MDEITPTSGQPNIQAQKEGVVLNSFHLDNQIAIGTNLLLTLKEKNENIVMRQRRYICMVTFGYDGDTETSFGT